MIRVSSSKFAKQVGHYQDFAQSQPVIVTRNGREYTVLISTETYRRFKRFDRHDLSIGALPDELLEAIHEAAIEPRDEDLYGFTEDEAP